MKYSCAGLVEASTPFSTRPGWEAQVSGVEVGTGDGVMVCVGVGVDGMGVRVGVGWFDGEQAVMNARSVKSVMIRFVHRMASLIRRIAALIA